MPYIPQDKRDVLDSAIDELHHKLVELQTDDEMNNMEGNVNYAVSRLLMMVYGDADHTNYSSVNDALGVLEAVKQEYYRKVAVPYETQKEFDNGHIEVFKRPPEVIPVTIKSDKVKPYNELVDEHGTFAERLVMRDDD